MRVLVSSTCYDLIDLRAEVEEHLRALGLTPYLSESGTSAFEVHPDRDSIATCLANARSVDAVIVILSQRYGAVIGGDYGDYSATHLEYREAVAAKRRIVFYVRDRLDAEYDAWWKAKKDHKHDPDTPPPGVPFPWSKKDGPRLCAMIEERRTLGDSDRDNWRDVFRNSLDVKRLIERDFKREANAAVLRRLIEGGKVPSFSYVISDTGGYPKVHGYLYGQLAALEMQWRQVTPPAGSWNWIGNASPMGNRPVLGIETRSNASPQGVQMRYRTEYGHNIEDTLSFERATGALHPWGLPKLRRRLLDASFEIG